MRFALLSSTPAGPTEGSGTWVALDGLARGLERLGHTVTRRPLRARTGFHTLDRWLYNAQVAAAPPAADVVVGVDLDGFLWARRRRVRVQRGAVGAQHVRFVVALKAEGQRLTGSGQTQESRQPVAVSLVRKPAGKTVLSQFRATSLDKPLPQAVVGRVL